MQLGCALPGQQLCTARQVHRPCLRPAAATGTRINRAAAAATTSLRCCSAAASSSGSYGWLQPAVARAPHRTPALQQQQPLAHAARDVLARASSLSLPEPSGDSSSSSSGQQRGATPIACDAGNTMDPQVIPTRSVTSLLLASIACSWVHQVSGKRAATAQVQACMCVSLRIS
jgi:hypothetical protein